MTNNCACELDADGQCGSCRERAQVAGARFKALVDELMLSMDKLKAEFMERVKKIGAELSGVGEGLDLVGPCEGCMEKYADFLLSRIAEALQGHDRAVSFGIMKGVVEKIRDYGVTKLPLTEKTWRDIGGAPLSFP